MHIAIMGAGAVGCYYGALLARAGHKVTLIGRAAHVEAINRNGLMLETSGGREVITASASEDTAAVSDAGLVLFCVKSTDTASAGQAIAPYLSPAAIVLSLQNGVDNAERLATVIGREVIPVAVYVAAGMSGAGHVCHYGRGELLLPALSVSREIIALLEAAGVPVELSSNAVGALWAKLIVNCAWNALSAITRQPYGALITVEGVLPLLEAVVEECLAVAEALDITVPGDSFRSVRQIATTMAQQHSSTAQDLARGRPSEIEHLNGHVVRKGQDMGIATPINHTLLTLVRALEQGS